MENETCSICREDRSDFETRCGHFFHEKCVRDLFDKRQGVILSCPTCNGNLTTSKESERILRSFALSDFKYEEMTARDMLPVIETLICGKGFPCQEFFEKLFELGLSGNTPVFGTKYAGFTPLHFACIKGDLEMVKKIIELGVDINVATGTTRFDEENESEPENYFLGENETALHLAIYNGNRELIKFLIEKGADVNVLDGYGFTPLLKAMSGDVDFELIKHFIQHGADITIADLDGMNSLHWACMKSDNRFFEYFINFAPDLNARTNDGSTTLHYAAQSGNVKAVKVLLDHGIDPTVVNNRLDTPLMLAMKRKHYEIIKLFVEYCSKNMKTSPAIRLACGDLIAHSIKQIGVDSNRDSLNSHFDCIEFLFDNFDDINIAVEYQQQFFKTISANKNLLDKVSKRINSSLQDVILIGLCEANNYELFMEYVGQNYNINSLNYLEENALFYATDLYPNLLGGPYLFTYVLT